MTGFLTVGDQMRLVEALQNVEMMRTRRSRDIVIGALERELGHGLSFSRPEQDRADIWQLIEACGGYPGALHALTVILEGFHGRRYRPLAEVASLIDELCPEPLLNLHERQELHRLLYEIENGGLSDQEVATIRRLYHSAVGELGMPLSRRFRGFEPLVALLEGSTVGLDGVPPLLTFVAGLLGITDGEISIRLKDWLLRFGSRLGLEEMRLPQPGAPPAAVDDAYHAPTRDKESRPSLGMKSAGGFVNTEVSGAALDRAGATARIREPGGSRPSATTAYLVVECRPDLAASGDYLVTAWLQFDGEPGATLHCDDAPQPLSGLPLLLQALLVHNPQVVNRHTDELMIEFILPRRLLNIPLDQWRITEGGLERRIGIEYPVVVRSLDRMTERNPYRRLRQKWDRLKDSPSSAQTCWIHERGRHDNEQLFTMLSGEVSACLALPFPPSSGDSAPPDEHWIGVMTGTPVIIWCRVGADPSLFERECERLIGADPLRLPQQVLELRRDAVRASDPDPDHLGLHLSLIFDNADRLPEPYSRLSAPN